MDGVSSDEVLSLLKRVASGEVTPTLVDPVQDWERVSSGNVVFSVAGWTVEVFVDAGWWDYIDRVVSPDGREGDFDDWYLPPEADNYGQPDDRLYAESEADYKSCLRSFEFAGGKPIMELNFIEDSFIWITEHIFS